MTTIRESYEPVNAAWQAADVIAPMTRAEAERSARRLFRFATGETFRGTVRVTSGNRYSYLVSWRFPDGIRHSYTMQVNPSCGWRQHVHTLSHSFYPFCRWRNSDKPHSRSHARLELRMAKEVIRRGWLAGTLRDAPKAASTVDDKRAAKRAKLEARVVAWERKAKRAETALRKLRKALRAMDRADAKAEP
jgi:hypothetical protein